MAGVLGGGHDNSFRENRFYGDYPGWDVAMEGPGLFWFTDESYGNQVMSTKLNGPPNGWDICGQVLDETDDPATPQYDGANTFPGYQRCH